MHYATNFIGYASSLSISESRGITSRQRQRIYEISEQKIIMVIYEHTLQQHISWTKVHSR